MEIEYYNEFSECLNRNMEFKVYGHSGPVILVFPAQDGRFYDFENFGMVDTVKDYIEKGLVRLVCVDSIDSETYSDEFGDLGHRSYMLEQFYYYIVDEIVPRIREITSNKKIKTYTSGCSLGATHAANMLFRRPDIFQGTIALSGYYDTDLFFGEYVDENVYDNAPIKYIEGMSYNHPYVEMYRNRDIVLCCGQGAWEHEMIKSTSRMQELLEYKEVGAWIDYWGYDVNHDWQWWQKQFPYFVGHLL